MTPRWKRRLKIAAGVAALAAIVLAIVIETGLAERWARSAILSRIEKITGGRAELKAFRFHTLSLRAELEGFTLHGKEPEGTPPFFHADLLVIELRVVSFLGRKISLDDVQLERPRVHVRMDANGRSNVPEPQVARPAGQPWREQIFELAIRKLRITDGQLLYNDIRVPIVAEGGEFRFALDFHAPPAGRESYEGTLSWKKMVLAARRYLPFPSDVATKFTLSRDAFEMSEFSWKLPHSQLRAAAHLESFTKPAWTFRYQGLLDLQDLRTILRKPRTPGGRVEFFGEGRHADGELTAKGSYAAREMEMPYDWFHTSGIESRGTYRIAKQRLEIPDFEAQVLGGSVSGRVQMEFNGLRFRVDSHAEGIRLASLFAAVDNPNLPVVPLHWDGTVAVDSVTTWTEDFKHFISQGTSLWSPPASLPAGKIPASARIHFNYSMDGHGAELTQSEIFTPASRIEFNGRLGATDSAMNVKLRVDDLEQWDDFINRLRGADAEPRRIAGRATWNGRILGAITHPTFTGHFQASDARYERLHWDEVEGDLTYSPDEFRLERTRTRLGRSWAAFDLWLELDNWSYQPESQWSTDLRLTKAPTDDLQALFNWSYPPRALLTGQFRGRGTRNDPEFTGPFELEQLEAWGIHAERASGRFSLRNDEVRIANAEIRQGPGRVTGNFLYRMAGNESPAEIEFDLDGSAIAIEKIEPLQTARLPLGGQLNFSVRGRGPLAAPESDGKLRLTQFRVGDHTLGNFDGTLRSDGRRAHLEAQSAMATGQLRGKLDLTLGGDYPVFGDATVENFDLDVFIKTGFRLQALTGHSSVDGRFLISGSLAKPETLVVEADVSRLLFDYEYVKLENVGPLRLAYRKEEIRIEQAHISGPETDITISGFTRFNQDRPLSLRLNGSVNLRLLGGFVPELDARGAALVNASIDGTFQNPRITGGLHIENGAANYGDFPAGLSHLRGDFVFDRHRLVFENVTAEAGGGKLLLGGTVNYAEGFDALRYDLNLQATRVRIRYPEGMSWLAGGGLRLSGTTRAGLLSGRVTVERLLLAQGFDLASVMLTSREGLRGPATASAYLRNLQFDVEGVSAPGARMEWSGARFESEASLRLRGTWEHPIFLGHVHLLTGEMSFRGNRYRLTRGDLNFSNPFRLDPLLNVEATTTIRQYEVTLNFSGSASRPVLSYRSDPPLPATDIIALLALGRTGEESQLRSPTNVQSSESGASTLLSEAISSQVGGRIERLFGVSRFRVDPFLAGTGTEQNASARVTIEQQVAHDLVITYITNVTSTQQQVIQVEYNVNRNVSIVALRDQNGTFGLDVKFKKRFK